MYHLVIIGDSKSYLSALPWSRINMWAYFRGFFLALSWYKVQKGNHHVLNVETEPSRVDGENWTKGKFGKLNQQKIRSVNWNGISASAVMKKLKNRHHFINIHSTENCPSTDPPTPKVWVSSFLSVHGNRISALAIMKKLENGNHFENIYCTETISNYQLPQSLDVRFSKCWQKWNINVSHYEKIEKWQPFRKYQLYGKISNYWSPLKFGSPVYPTSHLCVVYTSWYLGSVFDKVSSYEQTRWPICLTWH